MDDSLNTTMTTTSVPLPSQFGLSARMEAPSVAKLGDTIELTVHVTWTSAPHAWLLLPQTSPESQQLVQVAMSMEQQRTIHEGVETPEIQIQYRMFAKDTGNAVVPALTYDIPLQTGGAMHVVIVPTHIRIDKPLSWIKASGCGLLFLVILALLVFWKKRKKSVNLRAVKVKKIHKDLCDRLDVLAGRVQAAEPRAWMCDLEILCKDARAKSGALTTLQNEAFVKLDEAFAQARYGGGPRDSWETREWLRVARQALNLNRDEEENDG